MSGGLMRGVWIALPPSLFLWALLIAAGRSVWRAVFG